MRYTLNINKSINQLTSHFIGGRSLILYLQSVCSPLQKINDWFCDWATERRLEASMTSQTILLEWYLNHKFEKYFAVKTERITITDGPTNGVPIYWQEVADASTKHFTVYNDNEKEVAGHENEPLKRFNEMESGKAYDFVVSSPDINKNMISVEEYTAMLNHIIDRYKIACIKYNTLINKTIQNK